MPFKNNVVAGTTLVRDAIHSPNYVAGTSGWTINKDGTAEFSSVTLRGSLTASDGTDSVVVTNTTNPRVQFFKSGVVLPAEIVGFRPLGTGDTGIQFSSAGTATHVKAIAQLDEFGFRIFDNATSTRIFGMDLPGTDAEAEWAHAESIGGLSGLTAAASSTWFPLLQDGKVLASGSNTTTSASTTDVAVTSANLVNTPVILDRAYLFVFQVGLHSTVANDRAQFKIWNGAVGGTQMGVGVVNKKCLGTASQFETVQLIFIHRATTTETIANVNLSVERLSGTGTVNVIVDQNYVGLCLEIGAANNVGGL